MASFASDKEEIVWLKAEIATLRSKVEKQDEAAKGAAGGAVRAKIETMSAEVVDSNPYSRLLALQRMVSREERKKGTPHDA